MPGVHNVDDAHVGLAGGSTRALPPGPWTQPRALVRHHTQLDAHRRSHGHVAVGTHREDEHQLLEVGAMVLGEPGELLLGTIGAELQEWEQQEVEA